MTTHKDNATDARTQIKQDRYQCGLEVLDAVDGESGHKASMPLPTSPRT